MLKLLLNKQAAQNFGQQSKQMDTDTALLKLHEQR
jgi:hypothetical protein